MFKIACLIGVVVWSIASTAAHAQSRQACFESGEAALTTDIYAATRDIAASVDASRPWNTPIDLSASWGEQTILSQDRRDAVFIEFMVLGVNPGSIRWQASKPVQSKSDDCFTIGIGLAGPPGLWHAPLLFFDPSSAVIKRETHRALRLHVPRYVAGRDRFIVQGHADTFGSIESSRRMSQRRADAVARELIRLGVRETDIEVKAWGETRLARATADGVSEPMNRRVEIDMRRRPGAR